MVAIRKDGALLGIVYLKERTITGIGTGLVYGDATLNPIIVGEQSLRQDLFEAALWEVLQLPHVVRVRIIAAPQGFEASAVRTLAASAAVAVSSVAVEYHTRLSLPQRYDLFLKSMGRRTRRNFRYYRRGCEALGLRYVPKMTCSEFKQAAFRLLDEGVIGAESKGIKRALKMFSTVDQPLFVGIKTPQGDCVRGSCVASVRSVLCPKDGPALHRDKHKRFRNARAEVEASQSNIGAVSA